MDKEMSGRQILLMQQAAARQFIIDCSLAMTPGWIAVFREAAKDNQQILDALDSYDLANPSGMCPNQTSS
jgi:hypothetical protein